MAIQNKKKKITLGESIIALVILLLSLACVLPFIHVLSKSVSSDSFVIQKVVYLLPKGFTIQAYKNIFADGRMVTAMGVTILVTVLFTIVGMVATVCAAYPLTKKRLRGRPVLTFIFLVTLYFSAGLIPEYILMQQLGILNSIWVLILPLAFSPYNMLIMKSYLEASIPDSLEESAFLDGASNMQILFKIVLPLSKPIIATLSLFYMVGRWNAFADAKYYITKQSLYPIQLLLSQMVGAAADTTSLAAEGGSIVQTTPEVLQAACVMFATIPIIMVYPFVQKYFVKGVMIGAVKG